LDKFLLLFFLNLERFETDNNEISGIYTLSVNPFF